VGLIKAVAQWQLSQEQQLQQQQAAAASGFWVLACMHLLE
jgi:hypothetical protein